MKGRQEGGTYLNKDDVVGERLCTCDEQMGVDKESVDKQWNSRNDSILKHPSGNYHETSTSDIHDLSVKVVKDECTRTIVGTNPTSVRCRLWKGC